MSGLSSRQKGRRGEYAVRDYFRERGWKSDRVPLSGADKNHPGDVVLEKDGLKLLAEVKFRQDAFSSIYSLLRAESPAHYIRVNGCLISLSSDFDFLGFIPNTPPFLSRTFSIIPKPSRAEKRLWGMQRLLKGADFLVIKINNHPLLFIRYQQLEQMPMMWGGG